MKRLAITVLAALLVMQSCLLAAEPQGGRESLFILGAGGRALGMGGAYAAISDDATGVFWNPAGLSLLEHRELCVMHVSLYEETVYDFAAAAWPILDYGTIGIGGIRIGTGDIEFRDKYGSLGNHDYSTGQYWVSYGRGIYKTIHGGINFKLVSESLGDLSATSASIDVGLLYRFRNRISLGINMQDAISGNMKLASGEDEIPFNIKAGLAFNWQHKNGRFGVTVAGDMDRTEGQPSKMHLGGEISIVNHLAVRAGYDRNDVTFGGGVRYRLASMDYAYKSNEVLGASHRVSLTLFFGPTISQQKEAREQKIREGESSRQDELRQERADELWNLASDAFARNALDSALVFCNQVLGYDPGHYQARNLRGRINQLMEERAAEELETQTREKARADMIESRLTNGMALLDEGKLDEASVEFNAALKLDPDNEQAREGLTRIEEEIDRLVSQYRSDGNARFAAKDYGEAIVIWNKALELRPGTADFEHSIDRARRLMVLDQKLSGAMDAYSSGDTISARVLFNEVLDLDPENPSAIEHLRIMDEVSVPVVTLDQLQGDEEYWTKYLEGLRLYREKQYQQAIDVWQDVLEKYPGSAETKANIEQARLRLDT